MKRPLALLSMVLLAVGYAPLPAAADRADDWRVIAQRALDQLEVLDTGGAQAATTLAYAAQATAWLSPSGWADPGATAYLPRLYSTQNPDGGYGLGYAYDAHQDGTVNPANTSYVVTSAGYVGPVLLDAYRAGAVPRALVQEQFDVVATAPRIDTSAGRCIAYSRNANDVQPGLCVHNVNAGAAAFLLEAGKDGFAVPWWLIAGITKRELSAYNASTRFWPYKDATAPAAQDADHNSYNTEGMYGLAPPVAYSAAYVALTASTTIWCVLADQWLDEVDAFVTAGFTNIGRLAQVAYYASRASKACTIGAP